jgi:dolichol-phosphate mannosyltransferase
MSAVGRVAPRVSIVAPCFNEEAVLPEFVRRILAAGREARAGGFELILVNDGSRDRTWSCIKALATRYPEVVGLNLSRNHGHQVAVSAGLRQARGERVLVIDADLQDPPELLRPMMARMDEGFDVVYGRRNRRPAESPFKLGAAWLYYRILRLIAEVDIPSDTGDFRLMSRRIVDRLNDMPEQDRFLRGMVAWLGGAQTELIYDRDSRAAGKSKYTLFKMLRLAVSGVTSFSTQPLRVASLMSAMGAVLAIGIGVYAISGFLTGHVTKGWTSLALIVVFFATVQLACLGILGSYVGRIFLQVKGRPLFLVDEVVGGRAPLSSADRRPAVEALNAG